MLIRFIDKNDIVQWKSIAADVADLFDSPNMSNEKSFVNYMNSKIEKLEAICAVDRMMNYIHGIIGFAFYTNKYEGDIVIDNKETLDLKFFGKSSLPANILGSHKEIIEKLYSEIIK